MKKTKFDLLFEQIMSSVSDIHVVSEDTYTSMQISYRDNWISLLKIESSQKTIYRWSVITNDDNQLELSDEKDYDKKEEAIDAAKAKIDELIAEAEKLPKPEPRCPYCKRKIKELGIECPYCGRSNWIRLQRLVYFIIVI